MRDSNEIIEKYGADKCEEVWRLMEASQSPTETVMDALKVDRSEALEFVMAIMTIKQLELEPSVKEATQRYAANKHNLPSCPKEGCPGKLHKTISQSEEYNGMFHCDSCHSMFRKKA